MDYRRTFRKHRRYTPKMYTSHVKILLHRHVMYVSLVLYGREEAEFTIKAGTAEERFSARQL